MSDDLSQKSAVVIDDGQFLELAVTLSKSFGKVYYHNPSLVEGFPKASKWAIGNGFPDIEWTEQLRTIKDKVDLFVFPDIQNSAIQAELEADGKRVIGSRKGDRLELQRIAFKRIQKSLGLHVPKYEVASGLRELAEHLKKVEDKWIKIDRFRGTFETQHHFTYELSQGWLNKLAIDLGPLADQIDFLIEDPIRGSVEIGYDGFCFNGRFPVKTLFGPEVKSRCYIGSVIDYDDMDERLRSVNEALATVLEKEGYRNFFSTEVRIAEDDDNFEDGEPVLIEPTCRIPSPPFEAELETYGNLAELLWHGSVGEVIEPEMTAKFAVVVRLLHDDDPAGWRTFKIPEKARQWVKVYGSFLKDGLCHIAPSEPHANRIAAAVGLGNTIEEAIEHISATLEALKDQPISSEFDSLADALKEISKAEKVDIKFTDQEIPPPEIVVSDDA